MGERPLRVGFIVFTLVGMIRDVLRGHVGLDILAVVAMVATLAVGEYPPPSSSC